MVAQAGSLDLSWSEEELPQAQRTKHVHGLHPYLGKFIPQLVEIFLRRHFRPGQVVLDPFVGSGTTLVEANVLGIHAIGIDTSQFNCLLSRVKTARYDLEALAGEVRDILGRVRRASDYAYGGSLLPPDDGVLLTELGTDNAYLNCWYASRALQELLYYRSLIPAYRHQDVLKIILSRAARSARLVPHYDLDFPKAPVRGPYYCHKHGRICHPVGEALKFLRSYSFDTLARIRDFQALRTEARVTVIHGDARQMELPDGIDGVLTSPPYLGLIDYHEQHRYAYEFLGLEDHSELEIGSPARGRGREAREAYTEAIAQVLRRCRERLRGDGPVIFVVNDKYGLYPEIMARSGFVLEERITRQVNRRTGRRGAGFHEDVLIMRPLSKGNQGIRQPDPPITDPHFETLSGIEVRQLYTPADIADLDYERDLGFPGQYPFTRGIYPTMYRGRLWTMRQYAGYATAEESNRRYKYLLEQGQTGLSVAFDLPTQIGYDSDHPLAEGEVGRVGVAISSLEDMERLFDGIPLDRVSTSMTINATAPILLAMVIAVAKKQGMDPKDLRGTIQNDILKEYVARGTYIFPPGPSLRLTTDLFAYCARHLPHWNPISISGYHIREAGATAVQELAFTLANAIAYVQAAVLRGLDVDDFAPRLSFFFAAQSDLLEEVAKFRAARRLWARIMRERFGAQNPRSWTLRFHAQTAGAALTAQQPENNIVRVAIQALAAVLGGAQSLHCNAMDEALALPSETSARIALRTQQIIAHESGVTNTVDPLGGSYFVEALTNEIEARVRDYLERIEGMGGALKAIEAGFVQREIQESAYRYQRQVEDGERIVVGVNKYVTPEERKPALLKVDPAVRERQIERLRALRERRDNGRVRRLLDDLEEAARSDENLMPPILACVEAHATLGEVCEVLRRVFGEHRGAGLEAPR